MLPTYKDKFNIMLNVLLFWTLRFYQFIQFHLNTSLSNN